MEEVRPGLVLLAMGLVIVVGVGAAIGWAIISGWRDRDRHRRP